MTNPKITVITPSFNQGNFLEETILSVLNQNYSNLEYIIIDGGSKDQSVDIIKKYEKQLTYWVSEPDQGQTDAINKGLKISAGDVVNWLNSDDYYEPDALTRIALGFSDERINAVCARGRIVNENSGEINFTKGTDFYPNNLAKTIGQGRIDQPETFFRRSVLNDLKLLNPDLKYLMDRDLWMRYLLKFGLDAVSKIDDVIVNFRIHSASKSFTQKRNFQIEHDSWFYALAKKYSLTSYQDLIQQHFTLNQHFGIINLENKYDINLIENILNYYLLLRANELYASDQIRAAKEILAEIKVESFAEVDKKLLKQLLFRSTIPSFILKAFRQILYR